MALISAAFSVGNIIGPYTFQAKDAPGYQPAKITILATEAASVLVVVLLRLWYGFSNRRKNRQELSIDLAVAKSRARGSEWLDLTDKENTDFKYVY